jgi:hypothetical protein
MEWNPNFIFCKNLSPNVTQEFMESFHDPLGDVIEKRGDVTIIKSQSLISYSTYSDHVDFVFRVRKRENGLILLYTFDILFGSNVSFDLISTSNDDFVIHYEGGIMSPFPLFLINYESLNFHIRCKEDSKEPALREPRNIILKGRTLNRNLYQNLNLNFLIKDSDFMIRNGQFEKRNEISDRNRYIDDNFQEVVVHPSFLLNSFLVEKNN